MGNKYQYNGSLGLALTVYISNLWEMLILTPILFRIRGVTGQLLKINC